MTVNSNNNISPNINSYYNSNELSNSSISLRVENLSKVFESAGGRLIALRKINFTV